MIRPSLISYALVLIFTCTCAGHSGADPLADEISSAAAKWDAAINNADFDALLPLYTADGRLMPPGAHPVTGSLAIRDFFAGRGRSVRNHKVELVDVLSVGNYAYTTFHFTATLVLDEKAAAISGSTVRLLERQPDGQWKVKSHMFVKE